MGASSSKIEDDKALILCRERKKFVRQALDGRCSFAAAHVAYVQSLRNTGTALRRFVENEVPPESSLYTTSTSATPEPLALTDKSISQFDNSSPSLSQHVGTSEPFSPTPSPPYSNRFHVNHMKAGRTTSRTVEERPPIPVTAKVQISNPPKHSESLLDETFEAPPPPDTPPWDFFGLLHPIDNQFSSQEGTGLSHGFDSTDDIRRLREEEGIPELEEEEEKEKASTVGSDEDSMDSEDEFDQPSTESLVRMYRNRNEELDHPLTGSLPAISSTGSIASEKEHQNGENGFSVDGLDATDETFELAPSKTTTSVVTPPMNGREKEVASDNKLPAKDFFSCIKEIEVLFSVASDSGMEVPRMLEANKVHFRPLFAGETASKSKASVFLTSCFSCCTEEVHFPQDTAPDEMKYLTWHRSASSLSSSSRNLGPISKDENDNLGNNLFGGMCMNSGSHAATLDRLYAWERKLYDEVKASGTIRREYDMKCRLLRHQDSRGESQYKIDRTRASVKDLHSRIRIAIHRINSISKTIEEIRDKELQPQLEELIGGLTRMWMKMLDCHKQQYYIISASSNNSSTKLSTVRSESHRQATLLLQFELASLCSSFTKWMTSHESYLQYINEWLLKCIIIVSLQHKSSRRRNTQFSPRRDIAPPIFVTCRDWLRLLEQLPSKEVADAIKDLVEVTSHFLPKLEKGHGTKKGGGGRYEELHVNETVVDWSLKCDSLQSGMVVFLDRLKSFAEASVVKYVGLQKSIDEARAAYERAGMRP